MAFSNEGREEKMFPQSTLLPMNIDVKSIMNPRNKEENKAHVSNSLDEIEKGKHSYELMEEDNEEDLSFLQYFLSSEGPPQVTLVCLLLALTIGSTVGVVRKDLYIDEYTNYFYTNNRNSLSFLSFFMSL